MLFSFLSCIFCQSLIASKCEGKRRKMVRDSRPCACFRKHRTMPVMTLKRLLVSLLEKTQKRPQPQLMKLFLFLYPLYNIGIYLE